MKKVFAILLVCVLVVGAAFAATNQETHEVKITAAISNVYPAFQLTVGTQTTNSGKVLVDPADDVIEDYKIETAGASINFESATAANRAVTAVAKLVNNAKTTTDYKLTFSDGVFVVKRNGVSSTADSETNKNISPSSITLSTTIASGTTGIESVGIDGKVATVAFNGTTCTGETADVTLVSAVYQYAQDTTLDPTDADSPYEAYIVMTVATV